MESIAVQRAENGMRTKKHKIHTRSIWLRHDIDVCIPSKIIMQVVTPVAPMAAPVTTLDIAFPMIVTRDYKLTFSESS